MTNTVERILDSAHRRSNGCLEAAVGTPHDGYVRVQVQGVRKFAHVHVWEAAHGPLEAGAHVLHHCDNPPCCEITHLFQGTIADNNADRAHKGRTRGAAALRGSEHPRAKFTGAQVAEIRDRHRAGATQISLARDYGVTRETIRLLVHGRTYQQIVGAA